ncbi:MAG: 3-deoxy-7-phosphoheptulonate synthase, partial [Planctomycetota bacterium]|nr:3-deoxy-7-phosphoheptulonate synthase [Planctomycetota bacterium]
LGEDGLKLLSEAGRALGMPVVTEVRTLAHVPVAEKYADILQIGARNMQNFDLLREVGQTRKPVLLKRGMANTAIELLMAAEYVLAEGNHAVMLCERGVRTFETSTRFTLDVSAIPVIRQSSHLPVIVDPSHAAGKASLVPALARAGIAAGADGVIVEVHASPENALCDGPQALTPVEFARLAEELRAIHGVLREMAGAQRGQGRSAAARR